MGDNPYIFWGTRPRSKFRHLWKKGWNGESEVYLESACAYQEYKTRVLPNMAADPCPRCAKREVR